MAHYDYAPATHSQLFSRKSPYVYTALFEDATHAKGVARFDLTAEPEFDPEKLEVGGNVACVFWYGSKSYGLDPIYVPKNLGREVDEDDGYVLCFVFDGNTW